MATMPPPSLNGQADGAAAWFGAAPGRAARRQGARPEDDGGVQGFALWFRNFSTWEGVHGIYLEDLYVRPESRGAGHGKALLRTLAQHAVENGYARVEWAVLNWNEPSINFYRSLGALPQDEWSTFRLTGTALSEFGSTAPARTA